MLPLSETRIQSMNDICSCTSINKSWKGTQVDWFFCQLEYISPHFHETIYCLGLKCQVHLFAQLITCFCFTDIQRNARVATHDLQNQRRGCVSSFLAFVVYKYYIFKKKADRIPFKPYAWCTTVFKFVKQHMRNVTWG